ncbi:MAG: hypothetical protein DWQ04_30445 [Chloroflexi bacterium]|nr:MAG: hypothetical protein DWQ04_30445 [Chloroflexota bacterium]
MSFRVAYAGKTQHKIKKKLVLQLSFRSLLRNPALRQRIIDRHEARFLTPKTAFEMTTFLVEPVLRPCEVSAEESCFEFGE